MRAEVGLGSIDNKAFSTHLIPPGTTAASIRQFRSDETVNDGSITQHAQAFTLGGTVHF